MGCIVSSQRVEAATQRADVKDPIPLATPSTGTLAPAGRLTNLPNGARRLTMPSMVLGSTRRTSTADDLRSRRSSSVDRDRNSVGLSFFGRRASSRDSQPEAVSADPLNLGTDTHAAAAPTQWLVMLGERSAGKSTAIRQLKQMHDAPDAADASRFTREVHKYAVSLFKQVLTEATPCATHELTAIAERVKLLKRRAFITPAVAEDLKVLWNEPDILAVQGQLADLQLRKAVRHFASRLDELAAADYVPDSLDLFHVAMPTVGQQETRITSFPGGMALPIIEANIDFRRSAFQARTSARQVGYRHSRPALH